MNLILFLVFLVFLAVAGKYIFGRSATNNLLQTFLNYSGFYYLVLGLVFGPLGLNIFTPDIIEQSYFVFGLVLGWTGLLVGLQLNLKQLSRFRGSYYLQAISYFFLHSLIISLLFILFNYLKIIELSIFEIMLIAIAGSMTSTIAIALLVKTKKIQTSEGHFLEFLAGIDNVFGIVMLGFLFVIFHLFAKNSLGSIWLLIGSYLLVLFLAYVYKWIEKDLQLFETQMLVILAIVLIIVAGSKLLLNSILFLSFLLGLTLANLPNVHIKKLYLAVQEWEQPLNYILLFFVGVILNFDRVLILLLFYFIIVLIANLITEKMVLKNVSFQTFGLSSISLAMVLDAYLSGAKIEILTSVALIYFITNIFSIYYVKQGKLQVK